MAGTNIAKAHLGAGKPSIGTWIRLNGVLSTEMMARVGFDWVVLDARHSNLDMHRFQFVLLANSTVNIVPMVRVPWNHPIELKRTLGAGSYGVVIPVVKSRGDAVNAVRAVR